MNEELKPCPFCGSDDVIAIPAGEDPIFRFYGYMVTCTKCGGNLTMYRENTDDFREEVKKAWNRRACNGS